MINDPVATARGSDPYARPTIQVCRQKARDKIHHDDHGSDTSPLLLIAPLAEFGRYERSPLENLRQTNTAKIISN